MLVGAWLLWLANLGALFYIQSKDQRLWKMTKVGFTASTVANTVSTFATCWLLNQ